MAYRIMQRMETNEVVRAPDYNDGSADFLTAEAAEGWIERNAEQFPESIFWVESIGGFRRAYPGGEDQREFDNEECDDTPHLEDGVDNCDDAGTGEGRYHGRF